MSTLPALPGHHVRSLHIVAAAYHRQDIPDIAVPRTVRVKRVTTRRAAFTNEQTIHRQCVKKLREEVVR
jgi:hypothetical protein